MHIYLFYAVYVGITGTCFSLMWPYSLTLTKLSTCTLVRLKQNPLQLSATQGNLYCNYYKIMYTLKGILIQSNTVLKLQYYYC
jgi:hypothetical protein